MISHIKRTWLHELAHWFFFYSVYAEHRILSDGHEYLCTVCNTCGSERVLVHSSACDRCGS